MSRSQVRRELNARLPPDCWEGLRGGQVRGTLPRRKLHVARLRGGYRRPWQVSGCSRSAVQVGMKESPQVAGFVLGQLS